MSKWKVEVNCQSLPLDGKICRGKGCILYFEKPIAEVHGLRNVICTAEPALHLIKTYSAMHASQADLY